MLNKDVGSNPSLQDTMQNPSLLCLSNVKLETLKEMAQSVYIYIYWNLEYDKGRIPISEELKKVGKFKVTSYFY